MSEKNLDFFNATHVGICELEIAFPPDWVGAYVYDPDEEVYDDRFVPGMVVNFENGFGLIDIFMFTETGAKILGETPWELCDLLKKIT